MYRDAVSEGQNEITRAQEVPQLRQAIQKLTESGVIEGEVSFLFILANKKIEQRFVNYHSRKFYNPD